MMFDQQIASLTGCLAEVFGQHDLGKYVAESINHEFNSTFKVITGCGEKFSLRINVNSTRLLANLNGEIAWVEGYQSVDQLPEHTSEQLQILLLQRRVLLLNYLYETSNPEHKELIPDYQVDTFRRLRSFLSPE